MIYELEKGPIPDGHQVDHVCNFSLCCNPAHLEAKLPWANNARSTSPTAANIVKAVCPQGHSYSPENTGYRKGANYRYCRTCARLAQQAKRSRGLTYPEWLAEFHAGDRFATDEEVADALAEEKDRWAGLLDRLA